METVFIVGCMRTGSKIYMNLLRDSSIDLIDEIHYMNPNWLHDDFVRKTKRCIGEVSENNIDKLMEMMYSKKYYGTFWKSIDIDKNKLKQRIIETDKSFKNIFISILKEHACLKNKTICGAKFPVHISFLPILMEWFPNSKYIHLVRDPRAIFASQLLKYCKSNKKKMFILYIPMILHTVIQFKWSFNIYYKYKDNENYFLGKYEDIVTNPVESVKGLCDFLKIEYNEKMLNIPNCDSSYTEEVASLSTEHIDKYSDVISPIAKMFIKFVNCKEMQFFGYK